MLRLSNFSTPVSFLFNTTSDWFGPQNKKSFFKIQSHSSGYSQLDNILPHAGWSNQAVHEIIIPEFVDQEYGVICPFIRQQALQNRTIFLYCPPCPTVIQDFRQYGIPESQLRIIHGGQESPERFLSETLKYHPDAILLAWVAEGRTDIMKALVQASHQQSNIIFALSNMKNLTNSYKDVVRLYTEPLSYSTPDATGYYIRRVSGRGYPLSDNITLDLTPPMKTTIPFSIIRSDYLRKHRQPALSYAKPVRITNTAGQSEAPSSKIVLQNRAQLPSKK